MNKQKTKLLNTLKTTTFLYTISGFLMILQPFSMKLSVIGLIFVIVGFKIAFRHLEEYLK